MFDDCWTLFAHVACSNPEGFGDPDLRFILESKLVRTRYSSSGDLRAEKGVWVY